MPHPRQSLAAGPVIREQRPRAVVFYAMDDRPLVAERYVFAVEHLQRLQSNRLQYLVDAGRCFRFTALDGRNMHHHVDGEHGDDGDVEQRTCRIPSLGNTGDGGR